MVDLHAGHIEKVQRSQRTSFGRTRIVRPGTVGVLGREHFGQLGRIVVARISLASRPAVSSHADESIACAARMIISGAAVDPVLARQIRWRRIGLVAAPAAFVCIYALTVWTRVGQIVENAGMLVVLDGPAAASPWAKVYGTVNATTVAVGLVALVLIGWRRKTPIAGVAAASLVGLSVLGAELVKLVILPRPNLLGAARWLAHRSYPSGHATVALAFTAAALRVAHKRWRPTIALVGAGYSALMAISLLLTANHRLGDVLGSCLLVIVAATVGRLVSASSLRHTDQSTSAHLLLYRSAAVLAIGAVLGSVVTFTPLVVGTPLAALSPWAVALTECAVACCAVAMTVRHLLLIERWPETSGPL